MINSEEKIKQLIDNFEGKVCIYITDDKDNIIKYNENEIVETASCIKLFILIEYYNQILKNEKSRNDIINYSAQNDYVQNGSGIIQYLEDLKLSSKNMACLMMIVSDNIATNKMIDYLGFDNINNTIKQLGFIRYLPPKYLEEKGSDHAFIKYIATKSGGLGDEGKKDIINCRNDGGIISTNLGDYIVSIFISGFHAHSFYADNPASLLGAKINKIIFEAFEKNNGLII